MKYTYKTKPYKHQHIALQRIWKKGHLGLFWEPGVAKTKVMVDWSSALFMVGELKRVLVVCPLSVVGVWQDELAIHSPLWEWGDIRLTLFDKKTDRVPRIKNKLNICVVNFDLIWRRDEILQDQFQPQMVIADESHLMKKPSANRTVAMWRFKKVPYRAILTGTPTPRSLVDLYAQFKFLNHQRFGTRKETFTDRYVVMGGFMKSQVKGYMNVAELQRKVKKDTSKRRKDQCLDLPEEVFQRIPFELEPNVREMYNKLAYELFLELESGEIVDVKNAGVKVLRLQQLTGGWIGTEDGVRQVSQAKFRVFADVCKTRFEQYEKVVVFSRFIPELDAIAAFGRRCRVRTFELRGGIDPRVRDESRRAFQKMSEPALFVCQTEAGGLGVTLHAAREVIFYSPSYRLDSYIQDRGRVHRSGQTRKVIYRHLVARRTVDLDVYKSLRDKLDVMKVIMGSPKNLVRGIV